MDIHSGGCGCGAVRFTLAAPPILRTLCHCSICQAFNDAPYADISLIARRHVTVNDLTLIDFQAYRPPPNVQRGRCRHCGQPAIEQLHLPGPMALTIIPSRNFDDAEALPPPRMHGFYDSRVADIADRLPKYHGYWGSQLGAMRHLLGALIRPSR